MKHPVLVVYILIELPHFQTLNKQTPICKVNWMIIYIYVCQQKSAKRNPALRKKTSGMRGSTCVYGGQTNLNTYILTDN